MKKILIFTSIFIFAFLFSIINVFAEEDNIDEIIATMSNEEKIAQMIMPAFRTYKVGDKTNVINTDNIQEILSAYSFGGVILFAENTTTIEDTMRLVDLLQETNKQNNGPQLLISIDQEGGYVTRLGIGTELPGNMGLAATDDPENAYEAGKIIGEELSLQGINTNLAPVVDVNSNPNNSADGLRSFSDDPEVVAEYGEKFMEGLQDEGIITALKHFPGEGDAEDDPHSGLATINKTYEELKNSDLIPFQELINNGTDMIMASHVQYPNITEETYVSKKDGQTYTVPTSLSKTFLTDIIREEMNFEGVIVTDAFDMKAITEQFEKEEATIRAINAGANIILMPFIYDYEKEELLAYIQSLAAKIGTEIDEAKVNDSVKRILTLKQKKGLLESYDGSNIEERITQAKNLVSSRENHEKEFEITKEAVTMIKNENNVLPLNPEEKTIIFYEYASHLAALDNAITYLQRDGTVMYPENITMYNFYDNTGLPLEKLEEQLEGYDNVVMIRAQYHNYDLKDPDLDKMVELIKYAQGKGKKVVFIESHLPYEIIKFTDADALLLTYLANGIRFMIDDYESEIPKYGPSIIAGLYMLFSDKTNMNGILPVNIYNIDENEEFTDEVVYPRGFGLHYIQEYHIVSGDNQDFDNNNDLVIVADGNIDDLLMITIDGNELDASNYALTSENTTVTLFASYLSSLNIGSHTLIFVYKDGSVDATFSIKDLSTNTSNPATGDRINNYLMMLILSIITFMGIGLFFKKNRID